jgi:hypothetical protein
LQITQAYQRSGSIVPLILNHGTKCIWVISFTPWLLYPHRKTCWYPLHRRFGGPQRWFGCSEEQINLLTLLGIKPQFHGCTACNQLIHYILWYEVNGSRKVHNEELHNLWRLPSFAWKILREENTWEFWHRWEDNVKMHITEVGMGTCELDWNCPEQGQKVCFCEHGN